MIRREPIRADRVRRISGTFSWVDHRLINDGFLGGMCSDEILVYFFLVLVGDKNGVSFYSEERMCKILGIEPDRLYYARGRLIDKDLLATQKGLYQVLQLPEYPVHCNKNTNRSYSQKPLSLADILKRVTT